MGRFVTTSAVMHAANKGLQQATLFHATHPAVLLTVAPNIMHIPTKKHLYVAITFAIWLLAPCRWAHAYDSEAGCKENGSVHIWTSPSHPEIGKPLRIMAVSSEGAIERLAMSDNINGQRQILNTTARGGPPWSLSATLPNLSADNLQIEALQQNGSVSACRRIQLQQALTAAEVAAGHGVNQDWNSGTEAFYSAWIEQLFDAPPEESLNFPSLEPVLRNTERNFLYNYLGSAEDRNLPATPDCADLPYYLRAYFAWKIGLPISYRACSRGSAKSAPQCGSAVVRSEFSRGNVSSATFKSIIHTIQDVAHSGSARTGLDDNATDFYPVELKRAALKPGTVYADPYGHVLMLVKWIAQTATQPGVLLAVDAQPDNSVSRKRFWEGTFLFADNILSAGPGFKTFRPLRMGTPGRMSLLDNLSLTDQSGMPAYSLEQDELSPDAFYATMGKLINPQGLEPKQAYEATLDSLLEQLETRVTSVENGVAYFRKHPGAAIAMPDGVALFETIGPWEDYSTPSRDMRLIIAMNVLMDLPDRIVRHPELFLLRGITAQQAKAEIEHYHRRRINERQFQYLREDGSRWTLSVADILARKPALEIAYNPNDCAEQRWGAAPGSQEYASCRRHAPAEQHAKMERYRAWFREARRPSR